MSNQTPGQIELLKSAVRQPLICNQMQLSITHAPIIAQGVAVNMEGLEQSVDRTLGILDYSRLKGMTLQAWSPFQHKFFDGTFVGDRARCPELNVALDESRRRMASRRPAWLRHGSRGTLPGYRWCWARPKPPACAKAWPAPA